MARKPRDSEEGGVNLDSLMDALTNVVAVLILVLILVQADVTQKVQQFLDDLKPATPEEVAASKKTVAKLDQRNEQLKKKLQEEPPTPEQIEEEKRQLALLEKDIEQNQDLLADLEELRKLEAKLRPERNAENEKTRKIQEEIARLEALLDESRRVAAPPPAVVTIPDSRPIPKSADIYYSIVARNRVHLIDPFTPLEQFEEEFKKHKNDWRRERIKRKGADRIIYDQKKIAEHFKDFEFKNSRNQKIELRTNPTSNRIGIVIIPDLKEGGTAAEDLGKESSIFGNALGALARNRKAVMIFRAHPDSFSTYLEARTLADDSKLPAGWEVSGNTNHWIPIPEIEVNRLKEPEPPKKPPGKKPPPLKPKLD
ncbi:MAG: hypothetical protein AAGI48_07415 [Verrucomicrobiota bacterium]